MEYEGALYHVTARGDHQNPIYKDDEDRRAFLRFSGCGRAVRVDVAPQARRDPRSRSKVKGTFSPHPAPPNLHID